MRHIQIHALTHSLTLGSTMSAPLVQPPTFCTQRPGNIILLLNTFYNSTECTGLHRGNYIQASQTDRWTQHSLDTTILPPFPLTFPSTQFPHSPVSSTYYYCPHSFQHSFPYFPHLLGLSFHLSSQQESLVYLCRLPL